MKSLKIVWTLLILGFLVSCGLEANSSGDRQGSQVNDISFTYRDGKVTPFEAVQLFTVEELRFFSGTSLQKLRQSLLDEQFYSLDKQKRDLLDSALPSAKDIPELGQQQLIVYRNGKEIDIMDSLMALSAQDLQAFPLELKRAVYSSLSLQQLNNLSLDQLYALKAE